MKFTLIIKNNETGEILKEVESNAIVAGVDTETGTAAVGMSCCNAFDLVNACRAADKAILSVLGDPKTRMLYEFQKQMEEVIEEEEEKANAGK